MKSERETGPSDDFYANIDVVQVTDDVVHIANTDRVIGIGVIINKHSGKAFVVSADQDTSKHTGKRSFIKLSLTGYLPVELAMEVAKHLVKTKNESYEDAEIVERIEEREKSDRYVDKGISKQQSKI